MPPWVMVKRNYKEQAGLTEAKVDCPDNPMLESKIPVFSKIQETWQKKLDNSL